MIASVDGALNVLHSKCMPAQIAVYVINSVIIPSAAYCTSGFIPSSTFLEKLDTKL